MKTLKKALETLGRAHREILAVYLFGSEATGEASPLSDLDVAVFLDEKRVRPAKFFACQSQLTVELMQSCRRSDVDLVLLNEATPLLAYEVISSGSLAYERDHGRRVMFEAGALRRYFDLKPFFETARSYLRRRLKDGTYGG